MKRVFKVLSLLLITLFVFIGASCSSGETSSDLVSKAKNEISSMNIPTNITARFDDIDLWTSDNSNVVVKYVLSNDDYIKVEDFKLKYVSLPAQAVSVVLTCNITATVGDSTSEDSYEFNIIVGSNSSSTLATYSVTVTATNGRKLSGVLVELSLNDEIVNEGETDSSGVFITMLERNVYDVTLYSRTGYLFEGGVDIYTTKTDRNASPIEIECYPILIEETAPTGHVYQTGDQMYDFTINTFDNSKTLNLKELLEENELVVINFWYSDCSWCLQEFPLLNKAYDEYKDKKVKVIGITYSAADNPDTVKAAKERYGLSFDLAISDEITALFPIEGYPTTVFIDRYGTADFIEKGAILEESRWTNLFNNYLGDSYVPTYKGSAENGGSEQIVPDIEFPASSELEAVLNQGGINATYRPETKEPDATYSWPFIVSPNGDSVVPSNSGIANSYSIMYVDVELKENEVFTFDYLISTEEGSDLFYVLLDGEILVTLSGVSSTYQTSHVYVADTDDTYSFVFIYLKDNMVDSGDDTVYLKNFRISNPDSIEETLFVLRESSKNKNPLEDYYDDYITPVFNDEDGYYHVGAVNGPLLLADLMSESHFSNTSLIDYSTNKALAGDIDGKHVDYNDLIVRYSQYAVNSLTAGYTPVTAELKDALVDIAKLLGNGEYENEWLEMTVYFDVYGSNATNDDRVNADGQIIDPTIGLSHHNAIEIDVKAPTDVNEYGEVVSDIKFTMDRFVTTRGFLFKFIPLTSGVYRIGSIDGESTDCYVELDDYSIYESANFEIREYYANQTSEGYISDFILYGYFEAGKTYYLCPFYTNYGDYGPMNMQISWCGEEWVILSKASSLAYTTSEDFDENTPGNIEDIIISVGIDVELGQDGFYHQKYSDGTLSKNYIYFDIKYANMLINTTFENAFNGNNTVFDTTYNDFGEKIVDEDGYLLSWSYQYDENNNVIYGSDGQPIRICENVVDEHGNKVLADTNLYKDWKPIFQQWRETLEITDENDNANGCIKVNEEVKTFLELLMNKYSFKDIEGSWLKLCYYYRYFGPTEYPTEL